MRYRVIQGFLVNPGGAQVGQSDLTVSSDCSVYEWLAFCSSGVTANSFFFLGPAHVLRHVPIHLTC